LNCIHNRKYRNWILANLHNPNCPDGYRLWSVLFLYQKVGLSIDQIKSFIHKNNLWSDYDPSITNRQIDRAIQRKRNGSIHITPYPLVHRADKPDINVENVDCGWVSLKQNLSKNRYYLGSRLDLIVDTYLKALKEGTKRWLSKNNGGGKND
jgi:hypothetical protein